MARYTGPQTKIARTFGEPIFGKAISERRNCPPGQHGQNRKRKKLSEYGLQLKEKQKTKFIYGVLERQFRKTFEKAASKGGVTGENLLCLLEQRLDNVVYRLGIAPSRAAARQLVSHCHIVVNGEVVNIPSYTIKVGEVVGVREKSKALEVISESLRSQKISHYSWLEWNAEKLEGTMIQLPQRAEIPETINEQLIVELYSK